MKYNLLKRFMWNNFGGEVVLSSNVVGNVIAEYRKVKGLSQEVLSGLSDIGRTHLSMIERGERKPTLETFFKICNALDVKPSEVLKKIESKNEENGTYNVNNL